MEVGFMICDFIYLMMTLKGRDTYRVFISHLDRKATAKRSGEFLLDFLKVFITVIVYLATVTDR